MIEKHKVDVFLVNQKCDACKEGYMTYTGQWISSNPLRYEHRCSKCGSMVTYSAIFPHPEYEYKNKK
jgi:hypothetical protein